MTMSRAAVRIRRRSLGRAGHGPACSARGGSLARARRALRSHLLLLFGRPAACGADDVRVAHCRPDRPCDGFCSFSRLPAFWLVARVCGPWRAAAETGKTCLSLAGGTATRPSPNDQVHRLRRLPSPRLLLSAAGNRPNPALGRSPLLRLSPELLIGSGSQALEQSMPRRHGQLSLHPLTAAARSLARPVEPRARPGSLEASHRRPLTHPHGFFSPPWPPFAPPPPPPQVYELRIHSAASRALPCRRQPKAQALSAP